MKASLVPVALFVALILSVVAVVPLEGTAFLSLSLFGFMLSLGGLAWWVIRTDLKMDPRHQLKLAAAGFDESFDQSWTSFEQDFRAHVAALEHSRD
jgi:hypothetical protein